MMRKCMNLNLGFYTAPEQTSAQRLSFKQIGAFIVDILCEQGASKSNSEPF